MDTTGKARADMTVEDASWVWKNDQEGYDDWTNRLVLNAPDSWDGDDGLEYIITQYVRHLERLVTVAYGNDGLERYHEGVESAITAVEEMRTIRDWIGRNLPHVPLDDGVAKPVISLLTVCKTAVESVTPVFMSIVSTFEQQFRALGLYRKAGQE